MKKQNLQPAVCIFSADKTYRSPEMNDKYQGHVRFYLESNSIPYKQVIGTYDGVVETSFIIPARYEEVAQKLANRYDQELYLYLHPDRHTEQVDPLTRERCSFGQWVHANTKPKGDYTYSNGDYFEVI
jgi:hypothetical protein